MNSKILSNVPKAINIINKNLSTSFNKLKTNGPGNFSLASIYKKSGCPTGLSREKERFSEFMPRCDPLQPKKLSYFDACIEDGTTNKGSSTWPRSIINFPHLFCESKKPTDTAIGTRFYSSSPKKSINEELGSRYFSQTKVDVDKGLIDIMDKTKYTKTQNYGKSTINFYNKLGTSVQYMPVRYILFNTIKRRATRTKQPKVTKEFIKKRNQERRDRESGKPPKMIFGPRINPDADPNRHRQTMREIFKCHGVYDKKKLKWRETARPMFWRNDCEPCFDSVIKDVKLKKLMRKYDPAKLKFNFRCPDDRFPCHKRADHGMKIKRKKLPNIMAVVGHDCRPCYSGSTQKGFNIKRLPRVVLKDPHWDLELGKDSCNIEPPRMDDVVCWKPIKRQLPKY